MKKQEKLIPFISLEGAVMQEFKLSHDHVEIEKVLAHLRSTLRAERRYRRKIYASFPDGTVVKYGSFMDVCHAWLKS
jgi:hypothetical protein